MPLKRAKAVGCVAMILAGTACAEAPSAPDGMEGGLTAALDGGQYGKATGGGQYGLVLSETEVLDGRFSMSAIQTNPDGSTAKGNFHHVLDFRGQDIDIKGRVTCLTIDAENGRAWIGGVITQNNSEAEPWASRDINQPGRDVWFRVLDAGQGGDVHGRTTFLGFEGGAGIITSAEYCDEAIWADDNARTWAVSGNVQVHP